MKQGRVWVLSALLLIIMVAIMPGCSWFASQDPADTMIIAIPESSTSCEFWDIEKLRNDEELGTVYQTWRDEWSAWFDNLGIYYPDVKQMAKVDGTGVILIGGSVDIGDVRQQLRILGYDDGKYMKQERWQDAEGNWVVIMSEFVVVGKEADVKACIDVFKGADEDLDSLWDNTRIQQTLARLPNGTTTRIGSSTELSNAVAAWGYSWESIGDSSLKLTAMYLFDGTWAIKDAKTAVESYWESHDHYEVQLKERGEYLEVSAKIDANDFEDMVLKPS